MAALQEGARTGRQPGITNRSEYQKTSYHHYDTTGNSTPVIALCFKTNDRDRTPVIAKLVVHVVRTTSGPEKTLLDPPHDALSSRSYRGLILCNALSGPVTLIVQGYTTGTVRLRGLARRVRSVSNPYNQYTVQR